MNPLVSIITPTYNHERFIRACIESVLAQIYDNWEMIIVDDGSTDSTWDIVQTYAARDARIRAFHQENKGIWRLAETYNFALEQSNGELIAILEGDDLWVPCKLATQVPFHVKGKFALSFGQIQMINTTCMLIKKSVYPDPRRLTFLNQSNAADLFLRLLRGEYFLPAVTVLISRRQLVELNGFQQPPYLPVVDYPTWLSIGPDNGGFGYLPEVLAYWRQYSSQTTWLLAHDIAKGVYRFALEFAQTRQLKHSHGVADLERYLLSRQRRNYLIDASYRAAAVSFEQGVSKQAWSYCAEIIQLRGFGLLLRCIAMFSWKYARKLVRTYLM